MRERSVRGLTGLPMVIELTTDPTTDSLPMSTHRSARRWQPPKQRSVWSVPRDGIGMIRWAIWCYIILWLIEGGLRRWILPGLATPLLVVRDPVVLFIYWLALKQRVFPKNIFMAAVLGLAPLSWLMAVYAGHHSIIVATYGIRCDFLHVPLIFIMARVLTARDLDRLCRVALWIAIPYTALLALQFYSPQSAWVNRGLGGDLEGAGFSGALGRFRPPGTFSFISGPAQLYPMLLAGWFYLIGRRKLQLPLMAASGTAILLAIPLSISRSLFVGELLVATAGIVVLVRSGVFSIKMLLQVCAALVTVAVILFAAREYTDAFDAFAARWENSTTKRGGVEEAILGRVIEGVMAPFSNLSAVGYGTGISTQVGQRVATGTRGFGYSEGEWGRILAEGGIIVGFAILAFRVLLFVFISQRVFLAALHGRMESLPFWAAAAPMVLMGQWGQTTTLGSSIIASGVCLAATKRTKRKQKPEVKVSIDA